MGVVDLWFARYLPAFAEVNNIFNCGKVIKKSLVSFLDKSSILFSCLVDFGSDGAKVITGCRNGVAACLTQRQPSLVSKHQLPLTKSQAGDNVPYILNTFKPTFQQLFYFFKNSSVRMAGLKAMEQQLQTKELKLKKLADTHGGCQLTMPVKHWSMFY